MLSGRPVLHQLYQHSTGSEDFHLVQTHETPGREGAYIEHTVYILVYTCISRLRNFITQVPWEREFLFL